MSAEAVNYYMAHYGRRFLKRSEMFHKSSLSLFVVFLFLI